MFGFRRSIAALVIGFVATTVTVGQEANPATKAVSRPEAGWQKRHQSFVERAKKGDVDVLFIGDSITQGWEGAGKKAWESKIAPWKAANFGIGGDRTQHVLWRITEGKELEGIDPKVVVMMIGTNNFSTDTADQVAAGVKAILDSFQKQRPKAKILLLGVFPRSAKSSRDLPGVEKVEAADLHKKTAEVNSKIAKFADGKKIVYMDIGSKFLTSDGALEKKVMPDYLHLSPTAYETWADAVKEPVEKLLK